MFIPITEKILSLGHIVWTQYMIVLICHSDSCFIVCIAAFGSVFAASFQKPVFTSVVTFRFHWR
jgi:hypothetical protein